MIVRAPRPDANFTTFHNATIRDDSLSWKARGLLLWLLSMPENWTASADHLATVGPDGRSAVQAGLRELEMAGYLRRERRRNGRGQWEHHCYVYDFPQSPEGENPSQARPGETHESAAQPQGGNSAPREPSDKEVPTEEEPIQEELSPQASPLVLLSNEPPKQDPATEVTAQFEEVWKQYPRKVAKPAAFKAFKARLREGVSSTALALATRNYRTDVQQRQTEARFVMHGATFFGPNERWKEFENAPAPNVRAVKHSDTEASWMDELRQEFGGK